MANNYLQCIAQEIKNHDTILGARIFALELVFMVEHNSRGRMWDSDKVIDEFIRSQNCPYKSGDEWAKSKDVNILRQICAKYEALLDLHWVTAILDNIQQKFNV